MQSIVGGRHFWSCVIHIRGQKSSVRALACSLGPLLFVVGAPAGGFSERKYSNALDIVSCGHGDCCFASGISYQLVSLHSVSIELGCRLFCNC